MKARRGRRAARADADRGPRRPARAPRPALRARFDAGGTLLALGNGGSATDAMDVVADFRDPPRRLAGAARRSTSPRTRRSSPRSPTTSGVEAIFARQVIAYGREGDALLALSTSGNSAQRDRGAGRGAPPRAARRSRWSATTAAGWRPSGLADHVVVTRSEHIPRIQEAQASAYHVLRELVEREAVSTRVRARVEGTVQGVGFRPYVYRLAGELRLGGLRAERRARRAGRGRGPSRSGASASSRGCRPRRRRWPRSSAARPRATSRRPASAASRSAHSPAGGEPRRSVSPDSATCDGLPGRALRPRRPPLPLPVHQLHELRPALHDRARRPVRPAAHHDGRLRDVRGAARPSTRTRPTGASTPSRTRARSAGRGRGWSARATPATRRWPRRPRRCAPARSSRSRGSAATTSRAGPTTRRRSRRCGRASTARTSRSR